MSSELTARVETRKHLVEEKLQEWLTLGQNFEEPPEVRLKLHTRVPAGEEEVGVRDIAVSAAYQCYAPGIARMIPRRDERSTENAETTLAGGHHTTRMHGYVTYKIIGATRSVVHDVLHSFPFYNTSQQSQRYVEAKIGNYLTPKDLNEEQRNFYDNAASFSNEAYFKLLELLQPEVLKRIKTIYPEGGWKTASVAERLNSKAQKLSQENARYVLPIGQMTTLDYTVSELVLLRLFRAGNMPQGTDEGRFIVASMITELAKKDSSILNELEEPSAGSPFEYPDNDSIGEQKRDFDKKLNGRNSLLFEINPLTEQLLALVARNVLGFSGRSVPDEEILSRLLDPRNNKYLADGYDIGIHDPLTSVLRQATVTFMTRLSHTADSQRQRHRRTPGATPPIPAVYSGEPDYITPEVVGENEKLRNYFEDVMVKMYGNVAKALGLGIPSKYALLLLPNAQILRLYETGDLFDFFHRERERLCFRAQQEISGIAVEQSQQIVEKLEEFRYMFQAKCGVRARAGISPRCPEGKDWCGKPVFNWRVEEYKKNRLI